MDTFIVSNNPKVLKSLDNIIYIQGSYEEVLTKVRDLVYEGYELVSHPLGASARMYLSPYRSLVLKKQKLFNPFHAEVIENAIIDYRKNTRKRKTDLENAESYSIIDFEHLEHVLDV